MRIKDLFKSFFCVIFAIIIASTLISCSQSRPIKSTEEELRVVGNVGSFEVRYEEFRFVALTYKKALIEQIGENALTDNELEEKIRSYTYDAIRTNYAILTMCAEVGIDIDNKTLQEALDVKMEQIIDELGGRGKYKSYLKENYMTDSFFRFNTLMDIMQNELFYVYVDDLGLIENGDDYDKMAEIIEDEFVRTQHIYISKNNGKSYDDNRATAESAYSQISAGEDFMDVALELGEDSEMTSEGLYIMEGYMDEQYENIAFSLNEGEFSELVETDTAFYIIKRLPHDSLYVMWNYSALCETYRQYTFLNMIDDISRGLKFVPNEYLENLDILNM